MSGQQILWHSGGRMQKRLNAVDMYTGVEGSYKDLIAGGSMKLTGTNASPIIRRSFELTIRSKGMEGGLCLLHFNNRPI